MTTLKIINDDVSDNSIIRRSFKLPVFNSPPSNNIKGEVAIIGEQFAFNNGNDWELVSGGGITPDFETLTLTGASNQLIFDPANSTTLNVPNPAANRIVTIPDVGVDSSIVLTGGNQSINGEKTFLTGIFLPIVAPGTSTLLDYYEEFTSSGNEWIGPNNLTPHASEFILTRIGNIVTLQLPGITQAADTNVVASASIPIPARFRSIENKTYTLIVTDNSVDVLGRLDIDALGNMTLSVGATGAGFTNTNNWGMSSSSFNWNQGV